MSSNNHNNKNPLRPNVNMYILLTGFRIILVILVGRICQRIKDFLSLVIISLILVTGVFDPVVILSGEIRCWSLLEPKGLMSDNSGSARGVVHHGTSLKLL